MRLVDALARLIVVAGSAVASSCDEGLAPCEDAQDHLRECLNLACLDCQPQPPEITSCEGADRCNARCINDVSCPVIKDNFSGMATELSLPFRDCVAACQVP